MTGITKCDQKLLQNVVGIKSMTIIAKCHVTEVTRSDLKERIFSKDLPEDINALEPIIRNFLTQASMEKDLTIMYK